MNEADGRKIIQNLATLENWLNLNDPFQRLSVRKSTFSSRKVDDIIKKALQPRIII